MIAEAKRLGILHHEEAIEFKALRNNFHAIFITSAVHMCTPVQRVRWNDSEIEMDSVNNPMALKLRASVCAKLGLHLRAHSVAL